ncbi:MAG TPA: prepilin-type N-terminal cleavage/methylation domain-containing protein [Candidatus Paceibacterota bacterium]|nr:prepilin-type N-terminal cleavage/methylation domain-containing protein [Candidatus Paceibacterota bacterium]
MRYAPRHRAFTLVETLVAITVVTLAILAPFDAIQRVANASRLAKDNLIASALAQEGLEYVRFIRTSNYLNSRSDLFEGIDGTASNRFGTNTCNGNNLCELDATVAVDSSVKACPGGSVGQCDPLYVTSQGLYTLTAGSNTQTIFRRGFTFTQKSNGSEGSFETVTVQVTWVDHGTQTLTLTENLYDWF